MKIKRLCSVGLVLTLLLSLGIPAYASFPEPQEPMEDAQEETESLDRTEETDPLPAPDETQEADEETPPDETEDPDTNLFPNETEEPDTDLFPDETEELDTELLPDETEKPDTDLFPEEVQEPDMAMNEAELQTAETENEPIIQVTVPKAGQIIVNPYGLPVEIDGVTTTEKIASSTMTLVNHSNVPVQVDASVTGRFGEGSEAFFVPEPPAPDSQEKELFLYLEFQDSDDGSDPGTWDGEYRDTDNQILVSEETVSKQNVLSLGEGEISPAYGVFRLFGGSTMLPLGSWSEADNILISVAFTFTSLDPEPAPQDEEWIETESWMPPEESAETQIDTEDSIPDEDDEQPVVDSLPAQEYPGLVFAPTEETEPFPGFAPADAAPLETVE